MSAKTRFILNGFLFREAMTLFLPVSLFLCALLAMAEKHAAAICLFAAAILCMAALLILQTARAIRISASIKEQERRYHRDFEEEAGETKTLKKVHPRILLSQKWLLAPGRFALCREHIRHVSFSFELLLGYKSPMYVVKIKDKDGRKYKLILPPEGERAARAIRSWGNHAG